MRSLFYKNSYLGVPTSQSQGTYTGVVERVEPFLKKGGKAWRGKKDGGRTGGKRETRRSPGGWFDRSC